MRIPSNVYSLLTLMVCGIILMLRIGVDEAAGHQQESIALQSPQS